MITQVPSLECVVPNHRRGALGSISHFSLVLPCHTCRAQDPHIIIIDGIYKNENVYKIQGISEEDSPAKNNILLTKQAQFT